ncbi:ATP dependent DNA ligase domain-containing protein [Dipodascopsis uninucleata]
MDEDFDEIKDVPDALEHSDYEESEEDVVGLDPPVNHGRSPPFHTLITDFIDKVIQVNSRMPRYRRFTRHKAYGYHRQLNLKGEVIRNFVRRWKKEVGNNIYPCFRLLLPNKDKERQMYGLKEKAIAKLLIKVLGISAESEDAYSLLNYKLPGRGTSSGDFAERCYEMMKKREASDEFGKLTVDEVNDMLTDLSRHSKVADQLPIFSKLYSLTNAVEMKWIIRIILRQMNMGLSERSIFAAWHPDAVVLYNVTSSLKRVCWELFDENHRLTPEENQISLMNCFQPQLAAFPKATYSQVIRNMYNSEFWIEEKLDGERIQLHMADSGRKFKFFSRRAKDYTYLYGKSMDDLDGSLTKYLSEIFNSNVRNCILDGEMVSWDPVEEKIEPFGSLKSAAIAEKLDTGISHPLFRVFDIVFLNDHSLVNWPLADRRKALDRLIKISSSRLQIHPFVLARTQDDIERNLRRVIAESSEGLVIKNPRSVYKVNERTNDWIKVKPEYMQEFGENLDCLIIGGYYGQGKRGKALSSFLCGLRVDVKPEDNSEIPKYWSFCRVGGGFTSSEYATIRHLTDNNWTTWDRKNPPINYIELAGERNDREAPDVWIRPDKSVVIEIKAASVGISDQYRTNFTLRFPRFRRIREDKDYLSALSLNEFMELKSLAEQELDEKKMDLEQSQRRTPQKKRREFVIYGSESNNSAIMESQFSDKLFDGLSFCLMIRSDRKDKLQKLIQEHGGRISSISKANIPKNILIADQNLVKVSLLKKQNDVDIIKPIWIEDCIYNKRVIPYEPR